MIKIRGFAPSVIPLPSYLLSDDELRAFIARLDEIDLETGNEDRRSFSAKQALQKELIKRGSPIKLVQS